MGKRKESARTTTQAGSSEPWAPVQPYLKDLLSQASDSYNNIGAYKDGIGGKIGAGRRGGADNKGGLFRFNPYQGNRVAGQTPDTVEAQGMVRDLAGQPTSTQNAQNTVGNLLNFQMPQGGAGGLSSYFADTVSNEALDRAIPAATAAFSGSGLLNSSNAQDSVGRAAGGAVANAIAPYAFQAQQQGLDRSLRAAGLAPTLDQARYIPANALNSIGVQQQTNEQNLINADKQAYDEQQRAAYNALSRYSALLQGQAGLGATKHGTSVAPKPSSGNILGQTVEGLANLIDVF